MLVRKSNRKAGQAESKADDQTSKLSSHCGLEKIESSQFDQKGGFVHLVEVCISWSLILVFEQEQANCLSEGPERRGNQLVCTGERRIDRLRKQG